MTPPIPTQQRAISSYFSNRADTATHETHIDLTNDDDDDDEIPQPPPKKRRTGREPLAGDKKPTNDPVKTKKTKSIVDTTPEPIPTAPQPSTSRVQRIQETLYVSASPPTSRATSPSTQDNSDEGAGSQFRKVARSFENPDARKGKKKSKPKEEVGPSGQAWTPLEQQVRQLKNEYPGVILLVQEGYKYRFFGDDAKTASRELGIICYPKRNFLSASIPVERKHIHLKKLLSQGHKVGVVDQQETAALKKVGTNKSGPFKRGLSALYTAATFVDDLDSTDVSNYASNAFPSLMCLVEEPRLQANNRTQVLFGLLSVTPSTGDVVYDSFADGPLRLELETRLAHLRPDELLISDRDLSKETKGVLKLRAERGGNRMRVERYEGSFLPFNVAMERVNSFYEHNIPHRDRKEGFTWLSTVLELPQIVVVALAHCIKHLENFGLTNVFRECQLFRTFGSRTTMLLNANTVDNLEIFRNTSDLTEHGSLYWLLNQTKTKFGSRLLRSWIARPLIDKEILEDRFLAVDEIRQGQLGVLAKLEMAMNKLPDLAQGLSRIQYKQSTPREVASILTALKKIAYSFGPFANEDETGLQSQVLKDIVYSLPLTRPVIDALLGEIVLSKAKENEKVELWTDKTKYPDIADAKDGILYLETELEDELKSIRKLLKRPTLLYKTVSDIEFLIEIPNQATKDIPVTWTRISRTTKVTRYHTPVIKQKVQEREQYKEMVVAAGKAAFNEFLEQINSHYAVLRQAVNQLASADVLFSFARIATNPNYCKPSFVEDNSISIIKGRHPMVEAVRPDPFVPNSIHIGGDSPRTKIITGPNMGGKSSCVRMIALICIMAQVGCHVPAESTKLSLVDSVLTRMGAYDDLSQGKSTFMVEISETSEILRTATNRSLVILDELGRGTSTYDGMAIASSVFQFVVQKIGCKALFITHYPLIAEEAERNFPLQMENVHMKFLHAEEMDRRHSVHFLYTLSPGIASGSFGVECARLAGLPEAVLSSAASQSNALQETINTRIKVTRTRMAVKLLKKVLVGPSECKLDSECILNISELRERATAIG